MNSNSTLTLPDNISVYCYLEKYAKQYGKDTAISFYGKKITYEQLLSRIDTAAKALIAYGVKKDDVVAASLPGMPEGIYLIYAINKIGAIYCAFDCRAKNEEIKETLHTFAPKLCIVPNFQVKEFHDIHDCPVVYISPVHTLGGIEKLYSIPTDFFTGRDFVRLRNPNIMKYDRFIKGGNSIDTYPVERSSQDIFGYFYTSGTTYGRKSVILTNQNINASVAIHRIANQEIQPGQVLLNIMPLFTCYSVTLAVHLPLTSGVSVTLIPLVDTKKLKQTLLKEKPNYIITVPSHWEFFIHESFKGCDLSFMKKIIIGGDTIKPAYRKTLNSIFRIHGSCEPVLVGYGLTETTSSATAAFAGPENSVGRALPYMQLAICDPESGKFLPTGEEGEICIHGPTVCSGYFQDEAATQQLLRLHDDGKVWLHSGDRGYMDDTGVVYFCERYKRMYVRFDGTKISPYSIEQGITGCPLVENVLVVAFADGAHSHGMCAKAYVVLKKGENKETAPGAIMRYCKKHLDEHMQPHEIVIVDSLPHTKNGKLRYFE